MVILIAGPSGSGKTTFAQVLAKEKPSVIVTLDDFYFGKEERERPPSVGVWGNDPAFCDVNALVKVVAALKEGKSVWSPQFSLLAQDRSEPKLLEPQEQIIVEGLWTLNFPELRALADRKIYLEVPYEIRLERRLIRDTQRGRDKEGSFAIAHEVDTLGELHVEPYKQFADEIITFPVGQ